MLLDCYVADSCVVVPNGYQTVHVHLLIPLMARVGPGLTGSVRVHPVIFPLPWVNNIGMQHYPHTSTVDLRFGLSEEQLIH